MKEFFIILFLFFLFYNLVEAQMPTFAVPPGPEHVLVVYNGNSTLSDSVKEYYKNARRIPESNILPLNLPDSIIISYEGISHLIKIDDNPQPYEIIKDKTNEQSGSLTPTIHPWIYFNDYIVNPIRSALITRFVNGVPLKDIIRYIVICQDVPFKLQTTDDWSVPTSDGV